MGLFDRLYYGKAGKRDYSEMDMPKNRISLFFMVLKDHVFDLIKVNLMQLIFWIPFLLWTYINLAAVQSIDTETVLSHADGAAELLGQAAKEAHAYVSIGISERGEDSATLYNSNLVFSPEGELLNVHRKLKPTGAERLVYGDANKDYFPITDTPWGPMGNLICWESYMPLARVALYQKGITLYISPNTNDNPEWQDTIKHIAIEGHCFFINADMVFTKEMYPKDLHCPQEIEQLSDIPCRGGSCVVDPYGHYVTQPVWDKEDIIYADLDMQQAIASRMEFDGVGHYARPDVLELRVHE